MFKYLLSSVDYLEVWSVLTLIIFFLSFIMIMIYAFRLDKSVIDHMSNLPIEDQEDNKLS